MNLQQTINELEQEAKKYQQAADSLRTLLNSGGQSSASSNTSQGGSKSSASKTSNVSAATRAKISEALKARHAAKSGNKTQSAGSKANQAKPASQNAGQSGTKSQSKGSKVSQETRDKIAATLRARHAAKQAAAAK